MRFAILLLYMTFLGMSMYSQNKQLLYDFYEIPQSLMVNPGVKTMENWHAGVPFVSGLAFQASTSGVTVNDLFANDGIDFTTKVQQRVLQAMTNRDDISTTSQIEVFNVGFRGRNNPNNYYSFGVYGETDMIVYWPEDLAILAFEGNGGPNIGRSFDLGHLNLRGEMVNVFHFGVNKKVRNGLILGARAKLYSSIFEFKTTSNSGTFSTTEGQNSIYANTITADMELKTSGVEGILDVLDDDSSAQNDIGSLLANRMLLGGNLGLGFDAGFTYNLSPQTTISGSILDVGFIYHSKDIKNYTLQGTATNEGIEVFLPEDITNLGLDLWQELVDEIEETVPFDDNDKGYISLRPVKVYASIRYNFGENRVFDENCGCGTTVSGVGNNNEFYKNSIGGQLFLLKRPLGVQAALTGFYQKRLGKALSFKTTYTIDKYSLSNIGLGLNVSAGPLNFYILGDNLLSYRNVADSKYLSLQFGFNIISWNDN